MISTIVFSAAAILWATPGEIVRVIDEWPYADGRMLNSHIDEGIEGIFLVDGVPLRQGQTLHCDQSIAFRITNVAKDAKSGNATIEISHGQDKCHNDR